MNEKGLAKPQPGDLMPPFFGLSNDGLVYSSEEQAGRAAVLIIFGSEYTDDPKSLVLEFSRRLDEFKAMSCDVVAISHSKTLSNILESSNFETIRQLKDLSDVASRCNLEAGEAILIAIDRSGRVALRLNVSQTNDHVDPCLRCLARLPTETAQTIVLPAPILMLPNLLSPSVCRELIELFESSPSFEGKMASVDADNIAINRLDRAKKSRRDLVIEDDDAVWGWLKETVFLRCRAEIARAFQSEITCCDRLVIARYDETGGWFMRHRDNLSEHVAFREFAISINLNENEYDGGYLSFPEYNDHLYRPQAGAGIIFSASILHEATPVTRGSRYVMLTFFHGDAAENRRLERELHQNRQLEVI